MFEDEDGKLDGIQLEDLNPDLEHVGVLGPSLVGKTTLVDHLAARPTMNVATSSIEASAYRGNLDDKRFSMIDGPGDEISHQLRIAGFCDSAILLVDHNKTDNKPDIDNTRLNSHRELTHHLQQHLQLNKKKWRNLLILINKSDLWMSDPKKACMTKLGEELMTSWQVSHVVDHCDLRTFSNKNSADITTAKTIISGWSTEKP